VRDGNFTSSYNIRAALVVEYETCGRENVPFIDQGAAARNSIIRSKIRPLVIRQEDTGVAKGASLARNFASFKSSLIKM
jgi:hypothetical protein